MLRAYYNEIDPYAAQWIRNLIQAGLITPGEVDERSVVDVRPVDFRGFDRCHFFAGIAVWDYALALAGWPEDRPVWTGSCPCQPFSNAGQRGGFDDERHLWPVLYALVRECRPATLFGEQVASKAGLAWLDTVHADLEEAGYAVGAADLCAAGVGAPHIRQRLWFVADASGARQRHAEDARAGGAAPGPAGMARSGMAHPGRHGDQQHAGELSGHEGQHEVGPAHGDHASLVGGTAGDVARGGRGVGEPAGGGCEGFGHQPAHVEPLPAGPLSGFWADAIWLPCSDGKARPTEPGVEPLAHGITARVGRLRAYGNAIVAPTAAAFIEAVMECRP